MVGCQTERLIVGLRQPFCQEHVDRLLPDRNNTDRNADCYKSPTCRKTVAWSQ
jgi:hypothetical protein